MPRSGSDRAGRDEKRKVFQKVGLAIQEGDGILEAPFPPTVITNGAISLLSKDMAPIKDKTPIDLVSCGALHWRSMLIRAMHGFHAKSLFMYPASHHAPISKSRRLDFVMLEISFP